MPARLEQLHIAGSPGQIGKAIKSKTGPIAQPARVFLLRCTKPLDHRTLANISKYGGMAAMRGSFLLIQQHQLVRPDSDVFRSQTVGDVRCHFQVGQPIAQEDV